MRVERTVICLDKLNRNLSNLLWKLTICTVLDIIQWLHNEARRQTGSDGLLFIPHVLTCYSIYTTDYCPA